MSAFGNKNIPYLAKNPHLRSLPAVISDTLKTTQQRNQQTPQSQGMSGICLKQRHVGIEHSSNNNANTRQQQLCSLI